MVRLFLSVFVLLIATAIAQVTSPGSAPGAPSSSSTPDAPQPQTAPPASTSAPPAGPGVPAGTARGSGQKPAPTLITLDEAITLALANSPTLQAARTTVPQSQAQEITARMRPNPVLSWDALFIPIFSPGNFSESFVNNIQQFDIGVGYLIERGHKRQARLQAARDETAVTRSQLLDTQRALMFNVAQQFITVQLAESNLSLAQDALNSFQQTVNIGQERYRAGDISEADFLKIKLQLLQFQTDVSSARVAKLQGLAGLRQLLGYNAVPENYDV